MSCSSMRNETIITIMTLFYDNCLAQIFAYHQTTQKKFNKRQIEQRYVDQALARPGVTLHFNILFMTTRDSQVENHCFTLHT